MRMLQQLNWPTNLPGMTIYEQIKKVMEGKKGEFITSASLKSELRDKFGVNMNSVIPSDFCYNRRNDGIKFKKENRLFEYIERNKYKYLGENYPYTGEVKHKPYRSKTENIVGSWANGNLKYPL